MGAESRRVPWTAGVSRRRALAGLGTAVAAASGLVGRGRAPAGAQEATPAGTPAGTMGLPPDFKVVLHAAQEQNWPYVLSNLANLTREWPQARLRVVVDGSAVYNLQGDNDLTAKLAAAATAGVEVQVCTNALRDHQIDPATIPAFAQVVIGGVVALVEAQHAGFTYVKP